MGDTVTKLKTTGLHCRSCSVLVNMTVGDLEGVTSVDTDYVSGDTKVVHDSEKVTVEDIVAAIRSAGYDVDES